MPDAATTDAHGDATSHDLRRYWHPIARTDEVGTEPAAFSLLGEALVAFRVDGAVSVFRDLCIHRGAALSQGSLHDGRLVCPYHGWAYDRSGACVHIPALPPGAAIPKRARAWAYPVREAYGLVWVALADPVAPFPTWPDDAWNDPGYRVFCAGTYEWKAAAWRVVENVLDFAHFNFVHKGYTELADGPVIKPYEVSRTADGLAYAYEDGKLRREYTLHFPFVVHDRKGVIDPSGGVTWSEAGDSRAGDVTILTFITQPMDAVRSRIYAFVGRNHALDAPDAAFAAGFDTIMEQDRVIVEAQRPELIPPDLREELYVLVPDAAAMAYRRLLHDHARDAGGQQ
jgi:phenylpropionate dioxygenase-like ring-hydroxylating dioxygenase large terminal subunit